MSVIPLTSEEFFQLFSVKLGGSTPAGPPVPVAQPKTQTAESKAPAQQQPHAYVREPFMTVEQMLEAMSSGGLPTRPLTTPQKKSALSSSSPSSSPSSSSPSPATIATDIIVPMLGPAAIRSTPKEKGKTTKASSPPPSSSMMDLAESLLEMIEEAETEHGNHEHKHHHHHHDHNLPNSEYHQGIHRMRKDPSLSSSSLVDRAVKKQARKAASPPNLDELIRLSYDHILTVTSTFEGLSSTALANWVSIAQKHNRVDVLGGLTNEYPVQSKKTRQSDLDHAVKTEAAAAVVRYYIKQGACNLGPGVWPIFTAIANKDLGVTMELVSSGDPAAIYKGIGMSPLQFAIDTGAKDIVNTMIYALECYDEHLNEISPATGATVLLMAAKSMPDLVLPLVEIGADPMIRNCDGDNAETLLMKMGMFETIRGRESGPWDRALLALRGYLNGGDRAEDGDNEGDGEGDDTDGEGDLEGDLEGDADGADDNDDIPPLVSIESKVDVATDDVKLGGGGAGGGGGGVATVTADQAPAAEPSAVAGGCCHSYVLHGSSSVGSGESSVLLVPPAESSVSVRSVSSIASVVDTPTPIVTTVRPTIEDGVAEE